MVYNNLKRNILNKSDTYNLYKNELNTYKLSYLNLMNNLTKKNGSDFAEHIHLTYKLKKLKKDQNKLQNRYTLNDKINYLENFDKKDNYNALINQFKMDNLKLYSENKYLINSINRLYDQNKELSCLNEELLANKKQHSDEIIKYYKNDRDFYKEQYENLIEKQKEYNLFFSNFLAVSLIELSKKQQTLNQIHNLDLYKNFNIAYVLHGFPTLSETFVYNELKWLERHDFNVKIFTYDDPQKPVEWDLDFEVIRFDGNLFENLERLLVEHNIDLMHTHFVYPVGTNLTFPLAEKFNIPFTIFAHAYDIFVKENDKINNVSEIGKSKFCKGIFTLSEFHKNYLIERNVPSDKIIITRQATDYKISQIHKKPNKIRNIVSISRFVEKKGIDTLIDAAKLLENENLNFTIYGFGILENKLKEQITNLGLKNVSIKGNLAPNEVINVLKNSDLLVSPCRIARSGDMDGIPTIIFEAMAYGLPVLTTNVSAIPEIIKDYQNGFIINPNDAVMLSNKIKEIMSLSPDKLFDIRKNAQNDVQNYSSIEKTMTALLNTWFDNFIF